METLELKETKQHVDFVNTFTKAMTSDDIDLVMTLFNEGPETKWVIMATGETFQGLEKIRKLAERSVAARTHGPDMGLKPTHVFTNEEGTQLVWEYAHTGIVTERWPSTSTIKPAPGSKFELPIVLICDVRDNKIDTIREYFDLITLTEAGTRHFLYS